MKEEIKEFLLESNLIENEPSDEALEDAIKAWEAISSQSGIDMTVILGTHFILMKRLNPKIAGKFRDVDVRVGNYICPSWREVGDKIYKWLRDYGKAETESEIKEAHIAFEGIHPFEDGNGRVGRIIMNWQRVRYGLPVLVIHTGEEQQEYYEWFSRQNKADKP